MLTEGYVLNQRYQILRVLSDKGGMGVIYQATDLSFNNTVVIKNSRFTEQFLKQQHPTMPADDLRSHAEYLRKAFAREANLLRRLEHPALPPVIDYFMTDDGQQFFVMNFVPGKDLSELLTERLRQQQGPFQLGDVLGWAEQLLATLDYLHTRFESPIIHRDIKPANLKLRPDGQIKLLDFGLAKGAAPEMSVVDRSIAGYTPQYAPLEQMRREGTDARSDLYSLAVTLHHLLTGHEPPEAVVRASESISRRPDPLRPAHELNPQVPPAISAILQRAAALNPDERPATAAEMREALQRASQAEPAPTTAKPTDRPAAPTITDQPTSPSAPVSVAPDDQGAASQPAGTTDLKWEPPHSTPDNPSAEASTLERPRLQPAAPAAEPIKVDLSDQPSKPSDIAQPRSNRWRYAAAGVVLALLIGLVMFLNRNSSAPANASSEASSLSLAPTPTGTVTDSTMLPASQPAALQSFTEDLGNGVKLGMVAIPGGKFLMGSPDGEGEDDERPQHSVTLTPYYIGKHEVTQAQWDAVMGSKSNPSHFTYKGDNLPVNTVKWDDAIAFCRKLSEKTGKTYRLPTEAEWEYACRAGTTSKYSFGVDQSLLDQYAWYGWNSGNKFHPVGQKKPNAWGLFDMHGNAEEWCQDRYRRDYYKQSPGKDPQGPPSGDNYDWAVQRGGSHELPPSGFTLGTYRCAKRGGQTAGPLHRGISSGFRVACVTKTQ